jgi:hypothetical protein
MSATQRLVKEARDHVAHIERLISAAASHSDAASELTKIVVALDDAQEAQQRRIFLRRWARLRDTAIYNTKALRHYMRMRMKAEMKPVMTEKLAAEFARRYLQLPRYWADLGVEWNATTLKDLLTYTGPPRDWLFKEIGAHLGVSKWTVRRWDLLTRHRKR